MTHEIDAFTLRIVAAVTKQKQALANRGGVGVREPPTSGLGALRDLFHSFAAANERNPASIVVGLDCSDTDEQTFQRDAGNDARDALTVHSDHVLLVCNPARGANLGGLVKLLIGGIGKKTSDRNIPHFRFDGASVRSAELRDGRPGWNSEREKFVHIQTDQRECWFWAELLVDSEDDVRRSIGQLAAGAGA